MQTKPKSNSLVTHAFNAQAGTLTFNVLNAGSLTLDLSAISQANRDRAMVHGFVQRIVDAAAISRNTDTGLPASPSEKLAAMERVVAHYASGTEDWNLRKASSERETGALLIAALMELYPNAGREKIAARVKGWSPAERKATALSPKVKAIMDRMQAAAVANIDAEELLDGIDEE
jgi:hypothetical protein